MRTRGAPAACFCLNLALQLRQVCRSFSHVHWEAQLRQCLKSTSDAAVVGRMSLQAPRHVNQPARPCVLERKTSSLAL